MAETRLREHCLDTPASFYTFNQAEFYLVHSGPDGKRAREGDRGAAQPNHGDSEG